MGTAQDGRKMGSTCPSSPTSMFYYNCSIIIKLLLLCSRSPASPLLLPWSVCIILSKGPSSPPHDYYPSFWRQRRSSHPKTQCFRKNSTLSSKTYWKTNRLVQFIKSISKNDHRIEFVYCLFAATSM